MNGRLLDAIRNGEIHKLAGLCKYRNLSNGQFIYDCCYYYKKDVDEYATPLEYACQHLCLESVVFFVERGHPLNFEYRKDQESLLSIVLCAARYSSYQKIENMIKAYHIIKYLHESGYKVVKSQSSRITPSGFCKNGCFYFECVGICNFVDVNRHSPIDQPQSVDIIMTRIVIQLIKMGLDPTLKCCRNMSFIFAGKGWIDRHSRYFSYYDRHYYICNFLRNYDMWNDDLKEMSLFQMMLPILYDQSKYMYMKKNVKKFTKTMSSVSLISADNKRQRRY